ncbi:MAG TPA: hypothetical protein VFO66_08855 [Gemmatimonadaceae bacterium]|nr:hypothetical protein [Gemmatimonadaceae bacterium]
MRIHIGCLAALVAIGACSSSPNAGPLGDGMSGATKIVAVDSARPPAAVQVDLEQPAYVAVLLVAPGHSATLLYPRDSVTDNRLGAGRATVRFEIPALLIRNDSAMIVRRREDRRREDSLARVRSRTRSTGRSPVPLPLGPETPTYLLLVTSPQPLEYERIIDKTAGVSIPLVDSEALNAVGKAVRSTLAEPRTMAGYYQLVELSR